MSDTESPQFDTLTPPGFYADTWAPPAIPPVAPPTSAFPPPPPPPPPAPARRWYQMKRTWVIAAFAFMVGLGAVGSDDDNDGESAGNTTATTSLSGSISGGSSSTSPSTKADTSSSNSSSSGSSLTMAEWATRYGATDSAALASDFSGLQDAANDYDLDAMKSGCRALQRHVTTASSHLPTPNPSLTAALSEAYAHYSLAATSCIAGITNFDPDTLGQTVTYLEAGGKALNRATRIVDQY